MITRNTKALLFSRYLFTPVRVVAAVWKPEPQTQDETGRTILTPSIVADCWEGTFEFDRFKLQLKPLHKTTSLEQDQTLSLALYGADYLRKLGYDCDRMIEQGFAEEIIE